MAHHIYTTEGFVLDSLPFGEGNSFIYLFTRDLGLVGASARSVRDIKSKLRYGLQTFCRSTVSLVRGKNEWKVTSALPKKNFYYIFSQKDTVQHGAEKFLVCAHVLSIIKKLVAGEEKNEALFDIVQSGFDFLEDNALNKEEVSFFECILMLRIVSNLGYLTSDHDLRVFLESKGWNSDLLVQMEKYKKKAIFEINKSIRESQL